MSMRRGAEEGGDRATGFFYLRSESNGSACAQTSPHTGPRVALGGLFSVVRKSHGVLGRPSGSPLLSRQSTLLYKRQNRTLSDQENPTV